MEKHLRDKNYTIIAWKSKDFFIRDEKKKENEKKSSNFTRTRELLSSRAKSIFKGFLAFFFFSFPLHIPKRIGYNFNTNRKRAFRAHEKIKNEKSLTQNQRYDGVGDGHAMPRKTERHAGSGSQPPEG